MIRIPICVQAGIETPLSMKIGAWRGSLPLENDLNIIFLPFSMSKIVH
jgi:hypothetical protein